MLIRYPAALLLLSLLPILPVAAGTDTNPTSAGAARPPTWNLYDAYTESYLIPYVSSPQFGKTSLEAGPKINVMIDGQLQPMSLDTGSRGIVISKDQFPHELRPGQGRKGQVFYWSSGKRFSGRWVWARITFPDAVDHRTGVPTPVHATVPILVAESMTCVAAPKGKVFPNRCKDAGVTTRNLSRVNMMGIGFDRTGHGDVPNNNRWNQQYNPFLNLDGMRTGRLRAGYILSPQGVHLGLTAANTGAGFAFQKLIPTGLRKVPNSPEDWQAPTGSVTLDGVSYPVGQAVVDIGITDMLLSLPGKPASGNLTGGELALSLLNSGGRVGYRFTPGDTQNPLAPASVTWSPLQPGRWSENRMSKTFVNTGVRALNAFSFLYDGTGGYAGLQLNGLASSATAYLSPVISVQGTWPLPAGFTTDLPVLLQGRTIIQLSGNATLNAPVSGSGPLVIRGKGQLTLGCKARFTGNTIVQAGSVLNYSQLQGNLRIKPRGRSLRQGSEIGTHCDSGD